MRKQSDIRVRPIKSNADYEEALDTISTLLRLDPKSDSPEEDHLSVISSLVRDYEELHFPLSLPDPIEAIKCRMEDQNLTAEDLIAFMGSLSVVRRVLARETDLTLEMVRRLHVGLGLPLEVLAQRYSLLPRTIRTRRTSTRVPPSGGCDQETPAPIKSAR
jgi:HTH-type transcriptional regulator/antitoxin HigA